MKRQITFCLALVLSVSAAALIAQDTSSKNTSNTAAPAPSKSATSASNIAAAKAAHKVWVNLDSGVYHRGGRWYGKTKNGKFMSEDEAKKAGYKAAKRN